MGARLAFFTLEDLADSELVTCETTMLRRTITCRRRGCGRDRPSGLRRQPSTFSTSIRLPTDDDTHLYALGIRPRERCAFPLLCLTLLDRGRFFADWPEMIQICVLTPRDATRIA
jgi:hypothetical protein